MPSHSARNRRATRPRTSILVGLVIFLTLAGTAGAQALWTAPASTLTASASSGKLGITQTGFGGLAVTYNATATSKTAPVTVTNTSAVAGNYTLSLTALPSTDLAPAVVVTAWVVASAAGCTASTTVPAAGVTTGSLAAIAVSGTLAGGTALIYCVRTTLDRVNAATVNKATDATLSVGLTMPGTNWATSATGVARQNAVDTEKPSAPGTITATGNLTTTTLSWIASTDNVGVAGYDIYRSDNPAVVLGSTSSTSFTDTTRAISTSYSYTIRARDAVPNVSAATGTATIAQWFTITTKGICLDGEEAGTPNADDSTRVIYFGCHGGTNQSWKIVPSASVSGAFTVVARYSPTFKWTRTGNGNGNGSNLVVLSNEAETANQRWTVTTVGTAGNQYQITNVGASRCLEAPANPQPLDQLALRPCSTPATAVQTFTIDLVG